MVAIAISFFVIIIAVAISSGFRKELRDGVAMMSGDVAVTNADLNYASEDNPMDGFSQLDSAIRRIRGVETVIPAVYRAGIVRNGTEICGALFKGTPDGGDSLQVSIPSGLADKLGLELVIEDVEFDSIIAGVQAGKYDIGCAGMTVTEDRLKSVNFSTPYATGVQSVIVVDGSEITDVDKLLEGNYKVGVQTGTTGDIYMTDDIGEERIERFAKGNDAIIALQTGKIDAVVIDNEPAKSFVAAANK